MTAVLEMKKLDIDALSGPTPDSARCRSGTVRQGKEDDEDPLAHERGDTHRLEPGVGSPAAGQPDVRLAT